MINNDACVRNILQQHSRETSTNLAGNQFLVIMKRLMAMVAFSFNPKCKYVIFMQECAFNVLGINLSLWCIGDIGWRPSRTITSLHRAIYAFLLLCIFPKNAPDHSTDVKVYH